MHAPHCVIARAVHVGGWTLASCLFWSVRWLDHCRGIFRCPKEFYWVGRRLTVLCGATAIFDRVRELPSQYRTLLNSSCLGQCVTLSYFVNIILIENATLLQVGLQFPLGDNLLRIWMISPRKRDCNLPLKGVETLRVGWCLSRLHCVLSGSWILLDAAGGVSRRILYAAVVVGYLVDVAIIHS